MANQKRISKRLLGGLDRKKKNSLMINSESDFDEGFFVPYLIIIIPGLALAIHGKFLLKDTKDEKHE